MHNQAESVPNAGLSNYLTESALSRFHEWSRLPILGGIGRGDLDVDRFRHYLEQDYFYLRHYAKLYCRLALQADDEVAERLIVLAASILTVELDNHRRVSEAFGCDFDSATMSAECAGYLEFLDAATEDFADGLVAMLPCVYGYGYALKLVPTENAGIFRPWLQMYTERDFSEIVDQHCALIDSLDSDPVRAQELFDRAIAWEDAFWLQQPPSRERVSA